MGDSVQEYICEYGYDTLFKELEEVSQGEKPLEDAVDMLDVTFDDLAAFATRINQLGYKRGDDVIVVPPVDFRKVESYITTRIEEEDGSIDAEKLHDELREEFDVEDETVAMIIEVTCEIQSPSPSVAFVTGLRDWS